MKKTIYKYIFYEFVRYFIITLFALAAIVWAVQAVNHLDLVIEDGHAFRVYFLYSLLTLSKIFTKLIPFSFMIATVLTILKLEKDNELIALWTSGLNKIFIVNHLIRISLLVMFLQLVLTVALNPTLLNLSRTILKNSELQFVSSMFKEKQFNDTVEGLTIFIEEKTDNNIYRNIFIRDESTILSSVGTKSSTIIAKSGYMSDDEKNLILLNGNIQKLDNKDNVNIIKFEKTSFNLSGISTKSISQPKMQETPTILMVQCLQAEQNRISKGTFDFHNRNISTLNCSSDKNTLKNIKIEVNKRIGMPTYIPLIALICSFLLASRRDKKIYQFNKYIYFFIGFLILTLAEITVRYSGTSWNHTLVYYLIPGGMIPIFYFALIRKFKYENLY
tara:strand:- start:3688 stop:4854 length:1167 start_codon:yes stop_codon:yes gene_type:complete